MKVPVYGSNFTAFVRRTFRLAPPHLFAVLAGLMYLHTNSAFAGLSFVLGTPTTVGSVRFSSVPDSVTITAGLTGPGVITGGLAIPANRIQYDIINSDQGPMYTWTVHYAAVVGPSIIGAYTPLGYLTSAGTITPQGGMAYTTLFNAGYGPYNYNTGAPWIIDYEPDHITFSTTASPPGLPMNDGEGELNPTPYLPSFAILFNPDLAVGLVPADATVGTADMPGQVLGPLPGNQCLSIQCSNIVVQTCSSCFPVTATTFSATAIDTCCTNVILQYQTPIGTCLPVNSVNTVVVTAHDSCGNAATNFFTVTVIPGPNCLPTNCISITASNITAYTCNPCTPVVYNVTATDNCCSTGVGLSYNPPIGTCFPQNSTTPVTVTGVDGCGNTASTTFFVTVLPGPTCGNTNCISIYSSNIVAYTCSNCTTVPFNAFAFDQCCSNVTLFYNPPTNTCFPQNTTTPVEIVAKDACGNSATNYIIVKVLPGVNCNPTNCINIYASNVVAYTCSNCTTVAYNTFAVDNCCPGAGATLVFNPPDTTCFPQNSTNPVTVTAIDQCGNSNVATFTVTVLPASGCAPTNCISFYDATNIVAYTCSNCTTVSYNAYAIDNCCAVSGATLVFNPPDTTCFPQNSTNPVVVTATDQCGNSASTTFTVTVLPGANCNPTNCISIYASNVVAYTCSNCTTVSYNTFAVDKCCPGAGATLVFNPPDTTCFPQNSTNPVVVTATDQCGNSATATFTVTVLPASGCAPTNCISIYDATNMVVYTCSNCTTVSYNAYAIDNCCPVSGAELNFNPPVTTCFPQNTTTPVTVTAFDLCGNTNTATFTVTVLPAAGCTPTNCISLYTSNIVVYTCSNCTTVPFNDYAVDPCCTIIGLHYSPSTNTCFPLNSVTPVEIVAKDACGNSVTNFITVTVLPGATCGGATPGPSVTGQSGPGGSGTNYMAVWWPGTNGQLQGSLDLHHWAPLPGATNSPYVVPTWLPNSFYRLQYR